MIKFPVLNWLRIDGYAMYPGQPKGSGLYVDLSKDLSLVVGANGLGKSTLLNIAFRLLTGPFDIPGAARSGELGSARLTIARNSRNKEFAARVSDGAKDAEAVICFNLGSEEWVIVRGMSDERLISWSVGGEVGEPREPALQEAVANACGVYSFADWILVLRYVTFYLDDRQILFWDPTAQKQLLRSLFLPPADAQDWVSRERRVLEIDSKHRNRRAVLNQATRDLAQQLAPGSEDHAAMRARLIQLLDESETAGVQASEALSELARLEEERASANMDRLRAQVEADKTLKSYEQAKMAALADSFPTAAQSARFIWSQILAEGTCLVCGSDAATLTAEIEARLSGSRCAVCGSPVSTTVDDSVSDTAALGLWERVQSGRESTEIAELKYEELTTEVGRARRAVAELEQQREERENQIDSLNAKMPTSDEAYLRHREQVTIFQSMLEATALELKEAAEDFEAFVAERGTQILQAADALKVSFERYARSFLLGEGELAWAPRQEKIGQSSYSVAFPAYELRLRRNDGGNVSMRSGPGDVSESQKEFIDLAFRMALIDVAGDGAAATIIIDTPESSLDAVFSRMAAGVLSDFVRPESACRLVVASNLTDGPLMPRLVNEVKEADGKVGVLNLLEVALPTPAVEQLGGEYAEAFARLLEAAGLADGT